MHLSAKSFLIILSTLANNAINQGEGDFLYQSWVYEGNTAEDVRSGYKHDNSIYMRNVQFRFLQNAVLLTSISVCLMRKGSSILHRLQRYRPLYMLPNHPHHQ